MKRKNITISDLAGMVKKGFDGADKRFDNINSRLNKIDLKMVNLEQGQDEIKVRLDNVAYRFEVEDLQRRVKKLEFKVGIRRT